MLRPDECAAPPSNNTYTLFKVERQKEKIPEKKTNICT